MNVHFSHFCGMMSLIFYLVPSSTHAQNWMQAPDIPSDHIYSLCSSDSQYFTVSDSVIFSSGNQGLSWSAVNAPSTGEQISISKLYCMGDQLYLGTTNNGVWRSDDGGQSWEAFSSGLSGLALKIVDITSAGDSLFVGTNGRGIYMRDLGQPQSWTAFNQGLDRVGVSSIDVSGDYLVAGVGLYSFIRPLKEAAWTYVPWNELESALEATDHITVGDYTLAGTNRGLFRARLAQEPWQSLEIRQFPMMWVKYFTRHDDLVIAGIDFQFAEYFITTSADTGATWTVRAHEFAELHTLSVLDGKLWAGRSDGLWSFDLQYWTSVEKDRKPSESAPTVRLYQNQPNPFAETTTISFELVSSQAVTLTIYDITGRTIARLLDHQMLGRGYHSLPFTSIDLPSGVYVYQLVSPHGIYTQKMFSIR